MANMDGRRQRLAIIAELVRLSPGVERVALVKWLFLLKALRRVPLTYDFRLHTYGPFDGNVLEDVQYAEFLGILERDPEDRKNARYGMARSTSVQRPGHRIAAQASEFVNQHRDAIDWVVREFGQYAAPDLEVASTLVYVAA